ncbi:MAG TPA: hypothetical protein DHN29_13300 [Cytophagales bacterium]|nr:hypothetical protein [Cytophagales bacterium]
MYSRFIIALILFMPLLAISQIYNAGDTIYVWNIDGSPIYSEPNSNSGQISTLKHGTKAVVIEQKLKSQPFMIEVKNGFFIKGYWVKVSTNSTLGYVFDSDFSTINSNIKNENDRWSTLLQRFFGKRTDFKKIHRIAKYGDSDYEITDQVSTYENGTYTYTPFDGCFDHTYKFNNRSFNEVYHLMMNIYSVSMSLYGGRPIYQNTKEQTFIFSGTEATGEIHIKILKDGSIELFSYDCT